MSEASDSRWFGLPRFRLRTLLSLVALAALVLGLLRYVYVAQTGSLEHYVQAGTYGQAVRCAHNNVAWNDFQIDAFPSERNRKLEVRYAALQSYHQELSEKYDRAVWRPWLLLESDPPAPETD
jgi:uncharacterized protein YxeA